MGHPTLLESRVVNLKRGSGAGRVLLLPDLGGSVLTLVPLARAYPGPETVAGLELAANAPASIAALASSHISAAAHALGTGAGPWHLVGHGFGATAAMDMAHQLERPGGRVGRLVLLEPLLRLRGELEDDERRRAAVSLGAADRLRAAVARTRGKGLAALGDDPAVHRDMRQLDLDPALLRFGEEFTLRALAHIGRALPAYLAHAPRPISAPADLLLTADDRRDVIPIERRLRALTGGVTVRRLPCPTAGILRQPHAALVASTIASLVAGTAGT